MACSPPIAHAVADDATAYAADLAADATAHFADRSIANASDDGIAAAGSCDELARTLCRSVWPIVFATSYSVC